jgi:hypothetical protein
MDYFFSAQIRQYRLQVIRAFSNFSVSVGTNPDGTPKLKRVPCRYGDSSRLAETIITGNSENKIPSAPFISVYVNNMALAPERRAAPSLVSTVNVNERAYDGERYLSVPGNRYTVKRYAPVPFMMTFNVDFWCSNLNQKEELFEQTQVLFNGMVDIQTSNNPLDWTMFSTLEPTNITWSSRSIPIGTENPIDVMTVEYRVPIWINPPAQVTYQKAIEQIVTRINDSSPDADQNWEWTAQDLLTQKITTPDDANIKLNVISDFTYEISLCNSAFSNEDFAQKPTQITGTQPVQLSPGQVFSVNGVSIQIPSDQIPFLKTAMTQALRQTSITVQFNNQNHMILTNQSGGNIMLANIMERIGEIGLRRAIGATRADIRNQFLLESVMICFVGGIIAEVKDLQTRRLGRGDEEGVVERFVVALEREGGGADGRGVGGGSGRGIGRERDRDDAGLAGRDVHFDGGDGGCGGVG